jgi:SPP1 gp7 family putative phage head morphogenesis protein
MTLDIGQKTSKWNSAQWQKTMKQVTGVNTAQYEPWLQSQLKSFSGENVALIKSLKDQNLSSIETMTQRSLRSGMRHEEIAKQIEGQFDTTRSRARLIARDQVSKLNGQLTQLRQNDVGINEYIWRTAADDRVRSNHRAMDGKKCRWDDATVFWNGTAWVSRTTIGGFIGIPGEDYQCRCYGEPVFDSIYESIDNGTYNAPGAPAAPVPPPALPIPPVIPKPAKTVAAVAQVVKGKATGLPAFHPGFLPTSKVATPDLKEHVDFVALIKKRKVANYSYLSNQAGLRVGGRHCDVETLKVLAERATWYKENFGIALEGFEFTSKSTWYAAMQGSIFKVGTIRNFAQSERSLASNVRLKFHPESCGTVKSVIDHEYGHTITNQFFDKMDNMQLSMLYDSKTAKELKEELSKYSAENWREMLAEGWAEYTNNPTPRPLSVKIGKYIMSVMKGKQP